MKKNKTLFFFFLILFSIFLGLSLLFFFLFLSKHRLSWSEYWNADGRQPKMTNTLSNLNRNRGIKTKHQEYIFPMQKRINLSVDIEEIRFVEEERDDIQIIYDYRYPSQPEYDIDFHAFVESDTLIMNASTTPKNPSVFSTPDTAGEGAYRGSVSIHLPQGAMLDTLSIRSSLLSIEPRHLYENCHRIFITSTLANIYLEFEKPKQLISIDSDLGNVSLHAKSRVDVLDLFSNLGNADLRFEEDLHTLYLMNRIGNTKVLLEKHLEGGNLQSTSGHLEIFSKHIPKFLFLNSNSGNLKVYLPENSETYAESTNGTVFSEFAVHRSTDKQNSPSNIMLCSESGDIQILLPGAYSDSKKKKP